MTNDSNMYSIMMQALAELKPEIEEFEREKQKALIIPNVPSLKDSLDEIGPLPPEALFLGVAQDGLPVLLNLHDPLPGALLIVGDAGCGKTNFLKSIANVIGYTHMDTDVQFAVITNYPDEWNDVKHSNNVGVFSIHSQAGEDLILSLASWAHRPSKISLQDVVLLIDDVSEIDDMDFDAKKNLRWLLLRGASRRTWTIATASTKNIALSSEVIDGFKTKIFGSIKDLSAISYFDVQSAQLDKINAGYEFTLLEKGKWLKFYIPK